MTTWDVLRKLYTNTWLPGGEFSVVMEFTGLHDKKGNEIYEGDIIKFDTEITRKEKTEIRHVFFTDCGFMTATSLDPNIMNTYGYLAGQYSSNYEVIGNIYESPELLKF